MLLWWAAFFIMGLIAPPAPWVGILAPCVAAALAAVACALAQRGPLGRAGYSGYSSSPAAAHRVAVVACALVLWQIGGIEARQAAAGGVGGAAARYSYGSAPGAKAAIASFGPEGAGPRIPGVARLRGFLIASLDDGRLTRSGKGIVGALVLDYRRDLGFALSESYSYLGITHFLALSGMHLGVIAVPLARLLSCAFPSRGRRDAALFALLFLYAAVAGFPPSLSRALALLAAVLVYRIAGLNSGLLTALVGGCFVLAALDPPVVFDAGFQLSFAAGCAIALIGVPLARRAEAAMPKGVRGSAVKVLFFPALITCSVQFLTMPLVIVLFKRASLVSPIVNVIVSLPFTALLYLGVVYVFIPFGPLRAVLALPTSLLCRFLDGVPAALSRGPHPAVYDGDFAPVIYLAGAGLIAYSLRGSLRRKLQYLLAGVFLVVCAFAVKGGPAKLAGIGGGPARRAGRNERVLQAGGREPATRRGGPGFAEGRPGAASWILEKPGVLYVASGGGLLVVDEQFSTADAYRLVRELWGRGVRKVELCVVPATRLKGRHGIFYLVRRVSVRRVVCSPYLPLARAGLDAEMRRVGAIVCSASRGDTVRTESFVVAVFGPAFPQAKGSALPSDSLRLRCRVWERPGLTSIGAANNMLAVH